MLSTAGGEASIQPTAGGEITVRGNSLAWKNVTSDRHEIDLVKAVGEEEWAIAYAFAKVQVDEVTTGVLGIGSDDALRGRVNGELVHDDWAARGLSQDDDLVPVKLHKGANQLLLKVLNRKFDWGFACRLLSSEELAKTLMTAAGRGDLEHAKLLHASSADVNGTNAYRLTAYQSAKARGNEDVTNWLAENNEAKRTTSI